jgi:hypothetical protein
MPEIPRPPSASGATIPSACCAKYWRWASRCLPSHWPWMAMCRLARALARLHPLRWQRLSHCCAMPVPASPRKEIALLCQRAENRYVNSPCGIMDQFVVTAATAGHALLLNTRDLTYDLMPMNSGALNDCSIVVANSMVRHSVANGDYGTRRRELEVGQDAIRAAFPKVRDLGDADMQQLEQVRSTIPVESYKRCKHVITENARVREAGEAMRAGDAAKLGDAMNRSHASQRDDFEDSVAEIDFLAATASRALTGLLRSPPDRRRFRRLHRQSRRNGAHLETFRTKHSPMPIARTFRHGMQRSTCAHPQTAHWHDWSRRHERGPAAHTRIAAGIPCEASGSSSPRTAHNGRGRDRPKALPRIPSLRYDPACYLCPGNARAGGQQTPQYDGTFVFENDYAALKPEVRAGQARRRRTAPRRNGTRHLPRALLQPAARPHTGHHGRARNPSRCRRLGTAGSRTGCVCLTSATCRSSKTAAR